MLFLCDGCYNRGPYYEIRLGAKVGSLAHKNLCPVSDPLFVLSRITGMDVDISVSKDDFAKPFYHKMGQEYALPDGDVRSSRTQLVRSQALTPKAPPRKSVKSEDLSSLILAVAGDQDRVAFRQLFDHFGPRVKAFMIGQPTDSSLAEEIVQETFVNVWRKAGQFDPYKASASTWIFTIARNLRIDHLRKASRPEPDVNDPTFLPEPEKDVITKISEMQDATKLRSVISALPEEQQDVLRLAFFEEKTHPEVAAALDVPLGTVKSRIRLALKRLRSDIGETP